MTSLDHIAVSAATLAAGASHVGAMLGREPGPGGAHRAMGTHNRLSGMGDAYLEVIAVDPDAPAPGRPRWFDLDRRSGQPRLSNWILRVDDLDAALAANPDAGAPVALARGPYRWCIAVPDDGRVPFDGCLPTLIEWRSDPPRFPETGLRLRALTLRHPDADTLRARIAALTCDPRIGVEAGPVRLEARIDTPSGPRRLT